MLIAEWTLDVVAGVLAAALLVDANVVGLQPKLLRLVVIAQGGRATAGHDLHGRLFELHRFQSGTKLVVVRGPLWGALIGSRATLCFWTTLGR